MEKRCCDLFMVGDIACIIGDDSDHGSGRVEYSGLWTLVSRHFIHTVFAPPFAGLIAGTHRGTRPTFTRISENQAGLYRSATEKNPIESEATFTLRPPQCIDYEYWFKLHAPVESPLGDYLELSWCSYMNAVTDPAIYFISRGVWVREYSPMHGYKAMFHPTSLDEEKREKRPIAEYKAMGKPIPFHWSPSDATFDLPFYYGRVHRMVLIFMFDKFWEWRFFMSPTGGGGNALGPGYHNPAWDWSWVIKAPEVDRKYTCRIRLVYKPFISQEDVLEEYKNWSYANRELLETCPLTKEKH